ncbi:fatty acid desaturase [Bdellovibrio sp. HCB288]|uniref:fatty acid desaturase n=1 Tax=Bdellovibrio sp. HCB288 TaxID=3394355 RepID=UPI0039B4C562
MKKIIVRFLHPAVFLILLLMGKIDLELWPWTLLAFFLFYVVGLEIGMHRYYSHRSFEMAPWKVSLITVLALGAGTGSPMVWAGRHRKHHDKSDTSEDPHSPEHLGFFRVLTLTVFGTKIEGRYVRDFVKDSRQQFLHRYYTEILVVSVVLWATLAPGSCAMLYCLPVELARLASGAINAFAHSPKWGTVFYDRNDRSRNLSGLIGNAFGIGLHHNHHDRPQEYRQNHREGEYDLSGWIIERFLKSK